MSHPPTQAPGGTPPQVHTQGYPPVQGYPPTQQGYPPVQGYPPTQQGYPPHGMPPQGYPSQGIPTQVYPPQGIPPQGYPSQGLPPQGYPPQGFPPQGYIIGPPQPQQPMFPIGVEITLKSYHNKFICAEKDGKMKADRPEAKEWERWQVFSGLNGGVCFRNWHGKYLSIDTKGKIHADKDVPKEWESFTPTAAPGGAPNVFIIRDYHGKFLSADAKGNLSTCKDSGEFERWTVTVVGAATQDAGAKRLTLPKGKIYLRARNSKYLCSEKNGKCVADREKPAEWETWSVVHQPGGKVSFLSYHGKYLCCDDKHVVKADREVAREWESFESSHFSGSTFNLKTFHGTYLGIGRGGKVTCEAKIPGEEEQWVVEVCHT